MLEKLEYFTSTIAAITLITFSLVRKTDLTVVAVRLAIVIIVFYFVGIFVKKYLKNKVFTYKKSKTNKDIIGIEDDIEIEHADMKDE